MAAPSLVLVTFNAIYVAGNPSSTGEVLEGRLITSVWDKVLTAEASEIYNNGRRKDLHGTTCKNLVHWYKLSEESGLPSVGNSLSSVSFTLFKDRTIRSNGFSCNKSFANLTVNSGSNFTIASVYR